MKLQKHHIKYAALALLIVLTALFQNVFFPAAGNFHGAYFLIALTGAAAMFEPEPAAAVFGLLAGVLWDVASPLPDGVLALFFTVFACACSVLAHYLFRRTVPAAVVLTVGGSVLYAALHYVCSMLPQDGSAVGAIFFKSFLPCCFLTVLSAPVYYVCVRALEEKCGSLSGRTI